MKPPVCVICDRDIEENEGGVVYFKKRFSDHVWDRRMERIGGVGHPPYAEWFCKKHYTIAKDLENLTIDKAINTIQEEEKK